MFERGSVQRDRFQTCDRACQVSDGLCHFRSRRVVICRCALRCHDRCLQRAIGQICVAICADCFCRFDQRIQFCLGYDQPQLLSFFAQGPDRSSDLIRCRILIHINLICLCDCCLQLCDLGRADIVHIGQNISVDIIDRCFQIFSELIAGASRIEVCHCFAQVEQCADNCSRSGVLSICQQCLCGFDRCLQNSIVRTKRNSLFDHRLQCLQRCFACRFFFARASRYFPCQGVRCLKRSFRFTVYEHPLLFICRYPAAIACRS